MTAHPTPPPGAIPPGATPPSHGNPPQATRPSTGASISAPLSPWRLLARGAGPFAALVLANAFVQALLVAVDPRLPMSAVSVLVAAASGAALIAAVVMLWHTAESVAGLPRPRPLSQLVVTVAVAALATAGAALLMPPVVPLVVAVGCAVLAAGRVRAAGASVARHPLRTVALAIVTVLTVVVAWVADLLLGLLVTGAPAAAVSWLAVGVASAVLACQWLALALRTR